MVFELHARRRRRVPAAKPSRWLQLAMLLASLIPCASFAQGYPTKPVRYIVRAPPGGTDDLIARLMQPAIVVIQTLPVFAIAPVLVLWFGFGLASKIVMATLVIFFPVTASLHDGLSRLDPGLLDLARLHRASRFDTFRFLRLPAAVPALVSGLRMAATVAP